MKEEIFWLDKWEGESHSGYYCRIPSLLDFFKMCEEKGLKIVGIKKPKDYNVEFILEELKEGDKE